MLTVYRRGADGRVCRAEDPAAALADGSALWVDLLAPNPAEEKLVEAAFGIDAPTPADREALEESARFYVEGHALTLTATLAVRSGQNPGDPLVADPVSFILTRGRLVTVRQRKARALELGVGRASARIETAKDGPHVLLAILDAVVERLADHLQEAAREAQTLHVSIFDAGAARGANLDREIRALGRLGGTAALVQESLASLSRLVAYAMAAEATHGLPHDMLKALSRDLAQLERTTEGLSDALTFLLDASLGIVSVGQNNVLKALSIATIAFAPPTLIASIFGMNFEALGWIHQPWGPTAAFGLMALAPLALFAIAKWRRWF